MNKSFHNLLVGVSVLPALLMMPAWADTLDSRRVITENTTYTDLTASNIASSSANNGGVFYMEDVQDVTLTFNGTTTFSGNSLTGPSSGMGGVIGNGWLSTHDVDVYPQYTPGGKVVFNGATTFTNNTTDSKNGGGAIFNYGLGNSESPDIKFNEAVTFTGNSATGSMSADIIGGGAIHHRGGMILFDDVANFSQNTSASKGGAIISTGDMVFNEAATFSENTASSSGGAIAAMGGHITFNDTATFTGNTAPTASAIFATGSSDITFNGVATFSGNTGQSVLVTNGIDDCNHVVFNNGATFSDNVIGSSNGALFNAKGSSITVNGGNLMFTGNTGGTGGGIQTSGNVTVNTTGNVLFEGNETVSSGGALSTDGQTIFTANKVSFIDNIANVGYGGAIFTAGDLSILGNENIFTGNQAKDTGATKSGGGAIHNRGQTGTATLVIGVTNGTNEFASNTSKAHGGAIVARAYDGQGQDSDVTINGTTTFTTNHADLNGGAIWNSAALKDGTIGNANFAINGATTFTGNTAGGNGGAVYNDARFTFNNSASFTGNSATNGGGAIFNAGTLTVNNATFGGTATGAGNTADNGGAIFNDTGDRSIVTNITNSSFVNNSATSYGGAIDHRTGTMNIDNTSFTGNYSTEKNNSQGGAILLRLQPAKAEMHITNSVFTSNRASEDGGAISAFANLTIDNTDFIGNSVGNGGGAILVGSESVSEITGNGVKGVFRSNTSETRGGAIATRHKSQGDNINAKLDISGIKFIGNSATTDGGAFYNDFFNSTTNAGYTTVASSVFENNTANNGGAVYNDDVDFASHTVALKVSDSTFTGNTATADGGAIYNAGTLVLAGTNTFTGNKANGLANDIYNVSALTVESGTTTLDGGISGTGTLSIAEGATLNIGTATINQDTITLDSGSTLIATVRSGDSQLNASTAFSGDGTLSLVFSDAGTYHVFGNQVLASAKDQVKSVVYDLAWANEDKDVVATLKSVDAVAEENNLTTDSATTILGLAQSTSETLNEVAEKIQEKLASGSAEDKKSVEEATAAINPEKASVVQSATVSVQNTVTNLASSRMSMPTIGRNGGDINFTSGGVWAQGLYNKTKLNDQFNGYTRGVAAGIDGTIDKIWTVGAGYAFNNSDIALKSRDTDIDSNTVFVYGQYKPTDWYVNAVANYTWSKFSEQGTVLGTPVTGKYDADSFGGSVATGYAFASGITPELGLRYLHVNGETYTNSLGVKNKLDSTDYLTAMLGTKYGFNINADKSTVFRPELRYAVKYDLISDRSSAIVAMPGVASYSLEGDRLSRIGGEFGIGLTMKHKEVDVSLDYNIEVREDYTSQTGLLKFRYNF